MHISITYEFYSHSGHTRHIEWSVHSHIVSEQDTKAINQYSVPIILSLTLESAKGEDGHRNIFITKSQIPFASDYAYVLWYERI